MSLPVLHPRARPGGLICSKRFSCGHISLYLKGRRRGEKIDEYKILESANGGWILALKIPGPNIWDL